jgi:hypothetical protein
MFSNTSRFATLIGFSIFLSGCNTPGMFHQPGEAYVKDVAVSATAEAPPAFSEQVRAAVLAEKQGFPQTGAAKRVSILVTVYHLKNPGLSLLVGDNNRVAGAVSVVDVATGVASPPAPFASIDSNFPQGVSGLILAAMQDANREQTMLAAQASHSVLEQFYGTELLRTYTSGRQTAAPTSPPVASAPPANATNPTVKYVPLAPASHKQTPATS